MKIRKRCHPHHLSTTPPDLLSSTHQAIPWHIIRPSFASQKSPTHHIFQSAAKKFVSGYDHTTLHPNKDQRPPPRFLNPAEIGLEEKEITTTTDQKIMTTALLNQSYGCSSTSTSAEASAAKSVSSSLSGHVRWCEEDKAFPLKKRKTLFLERFIDKEKHNKKNKNIVDSKVDPVRWKRDGWGNETNNEKEREYEINVEISSSSAAIEENVRCTRTNGVEWRCSKRRVEGYAWCEHHVNSARTMKHLEYCRNRGPEAENVKKYWGMKDEGRLRDFKIGKKRKRVMISSILDRTVPLFAGADN